MVTIGLRLRKPLRQSWFFLNEPGGQARIPLPSSFKIRGVTMRYVVVMHTKLGGGFVSRDSVTGSERIGCLKPEMHSLGFIIVSMTFRGCFMGNKFVYCNR
jgi:hypothetical protein